MKKILLVTFFMFTKLLLAQDAWRSIGPDDFNQASYNAVNSSKIISKNDNLYVLNYEYLVSGNYNHMEINKYDGVKWSSINSPLYTDSNSGNYSSIDLAVDNNDVPYLSYVETFGTITTNYSLIIKKFDGTAWTAVGPNTYVSEGQAYYSKLAINSDNKLYVIYNDVSVNGKATVKKFNGTDWELVGSQGFTPTMILSPSIHIDENDTVFMTYRNNGLLYIKKFNGVNWVDVGVSGFPSFQDSNNINQSPLVFDDNDTPYIAYCDNVNNKKLSVRKFNGINWEIVGGLGFTVDPIRNPSLSMSNDNIPYVVFSNSSSNKVNAVKFNGSGWEVVGQSDFSEQHAGWPTIAFDDNNSPFVSYREGASHSSSHTPQAIVKKLNGSNWETIVDAPISKGSSRYSRIAIDQNNIPYVAYKDFNNYGKIAVKKFVSGNWEVVGNLGFSEGEIFETFLKFDNNNNLYVAYNGSFNNGKIYVKKFNGTSWEVVGSEYFSPNYPSVFYLNFDHNNTPYIIYGGGTSMAENPRCSVQKFNGTSWQLVGSPYFSINEVKYVEILFDTNNNPMVAYSVGDYFYFNMFNGSNWVTNSPQVYIPQYGQIHFDNNGTQYLSYVTTGYKMSVKKKLNNGSWVFVGQDGFSGGFQANWRALMAFDSGNTPYIAYSGIDINNPQAGSTREKYVVSVRKFNGTNWETLGSEDISAGTVQHYSLNVKNNIPYICYGANNNENGLFAKYFGAEGVLSSHEDTSLVSEKIIFPNPVKNTFTISGNEVVDEIEIYDLVGKRVLYKQNPKKEISIEFLPSGFYISKIKTGKGISTVKLIKE